MAKLLRILFAGAAVSAARGASGDLLDRSDQPDATSDLDKLDLGDVVFDATPGLMHEEGDGSRRRLAVNYGRMLDCSTTSAESREYCGRHHVDC